MMSSRKERNTDLQAWEKSYQRSWEILEEDESGRLKSIDNEAQHSKKRRLEDDEARVVRRGLMRYLVLILDMSKAMNDIDYKPARHVAVIECCKDFVRQFFDENPLSQLSILITRNGISEKITELGSNPRRHLDGLDNVTVSGDPSIQNALDTSLAILNQIPTYGSREVLFIYGALYTRDPGDIHASIQKMAQHRVRCSVIGLAAEIYVLRALSDATHGKYDVSLDHQHLRDLLKAHTHPPPIPADDPQNKSLRDYVQMGFPQHKSEEFPTPCACHERLCKGGYICPKCRAKACELPSVCAVCNLQLISSPHLARTYHHLFPIPVFPDVTEPGATDTTTSAGERMWACTGCNRRQSHRDKGVVKSVCPSCNSPYCIDCDSFIHDSLHNCPTCEFSKR